MMFYCDIPSTCTCSDKIFVINVEYRRKNILKNALLKSGIITAIKPTYVFRN